MRKSSIRPLVQLPIKAESIFVFFTVSTEISSCGCPGFATIGTNLVMSSSKVLTYTASASAFTA